MPYRADMPREEQIERRKAARKKWYEGNKEAILTRQRKYQKDNKEKVSAYKKKWAEETGQSEKRKEYMRQKNWRYFGYPEPTRPMPDACECCGKKETAKGRVNLNLDHCHVTGAFRGWLCSKCNLGIGKLGDSIEAVSKALSYLKRAVQ